MSAQTALHQHEHRRSQTVKGILVPEFTCGFDRAHAGRKITIRPEIIAIDHGGILKVVAGQSEGTFADGLHKSGSGYARSSLPFWNSSTGRVHNRGWDSRERRSRLPAPGVLEAEPHSAAQHQRGETELPRYSLCGRQANDRRAP
jgi:hypothetical protein